MKSLADRIAVIVCACALLFLVLAGSVSTKSPEIEAAPLPAMEAQEPAIAGSGFAPNAVILGLTPTVRGVELYGSRVAGDASTGTVRTRWYRPAASFYLLLAGFPDAQRGYIGLELNTSAGLREQKLELDEDPEYWRLQKVHIRDMQNVSAFRIVATDKSQVSMGWLGFSQPFTIRGQDTLEVLKQIILVVLCAALCLVVFIGPGLVIRARSSRAQSSIWLFVPGVLLMLVLGLLAWKGPEIPSPLVVSRFGLAAVVVLVTYELARRPLTSLTSYTERRIVTLLIVLIALAVAKASYSIGPSGELYRGSVSRTLEVGARADSRISYEVVQIIALRKSAYSDVASALFAPWNFSHRGPLAGIAVSPIVLASGARIAPAMPSDPWTLFDPDGFAAYRIGMIVLDAASLLVIYALSCLFLSEEWAAFAFFVAAAAPFTIHELFFTWPKIIAAAFVLLGFYLAKTGRYFPAGLSIGLGYLFHPSALLWFPFALLAIPLFDASPNVEKKKRAFEWSKRAALMIVGLALWILLWRHLNRGRFEQTGFFGYFQEAGGLPVTLANWLWFRLLTALKTLVPFYIFLFHRHDKDLIALDGTTQPWVAFVLQYWCSLAFACGIAFYFALLRIAVTSFTRAVFWMALVFVPSLLLFIAYFGAPNTGLMREGMQAWFLGFIIFAVITWERYLPASRIFWKFAAAALVFRAIEILWILIPFASWTRGYILQPPFQAGDFCCLFVMLSGCIWLAFEAARHCSLLSRVEVITQPTCTTAVRQY